MQFNQSLTPELFYESDIDENLIQFKLESGNDLVDEAKLEFQWEVKSINYKEGFITF